MIGLTEVRYISFKWLKLEVSIALSSFFGPSLPTFFFCFTPIVPFPTHYRRNEYRKTRSCDVGFPVYPRRNAAHLRPFAVNGRRIIRNTHAGRPSTHFDTLLRLAHTCRRVYVNGREKDRLVVPPNVSRDVRRVSIVTIAFRGLFETSRVAFLLRPINRSNGLTIP